MTMRCHADPSPGRKGWPILLVLFLAAVPTLAVHAAPPASSTVTLNAEDRDALGRVAYAEAASQREEGLAAVVHVVLNRVAAGRFGAGVPGVLDAPGQFEPVMRAGGTWRNLPPLTDSQRLVFSTILDLILQGRLPDPTAGSTHFQNAAIVAQRAAAGAVAPDLVNFGGQVPAAVIRDHSFFRDGGAPQSVAPHRPADPAVANAMPPASLPAKFIRIGAAARAAAVHVKIVRGALPPAL